jgi:hypothetical protein
VDALIWSSTIARARGEHSVGIDLAETALRLAREHDFRVCIARALTVLAEIHSDQGDDAAASRVADEASALCRLIG